MPASRNDPKEWAPVELFKVQTVEGALNAPWKYILSNQACYQEETFAKVSVDFIFHPERNSKNIRRADILSDNGINNENVSFESLEQLHVEGMRCVRIIRSRLMPRNPNLDPELDQTCYLFAADTSSPHTLVIYLLHMENAPLPYYAPHARGIAYELREGNIYLAILPFPRAPIDERLSRVSLSLLKKIHRHCMGTEVGYVKRVHHDLLVDKSSFQDLYITLKDKYAKPLIQNWVESTDPQKHVFEDIAIAAFLILLWSENKGEETRFVDIGCGNGTLVYLLTMEGHEGYGFDARKRKSWTTFPSQVQERLLEKVLIPHFIQSDSPVEDGIHNGIFKDGEFLISNHADQLTPWTPLLAALTPNSGFLAIPCCEQDFSGCKVSGGLLKLSPLKEGNRGRYTSYCEWISQISKAMGWSVEKEMLRIPSTRNTGIAGRKIDFVKDKEKALEIIKEFGGDNGYRGFIERALKLKASAS